MSSRRAPSDASPARTRSHSRRHISTAGNIRLPSDYERDIQTPQAPITTAPRTPPRDEPPSIPPIGTITPIEPHVTVQALYGDGTEEIQHILVPQSTEVDDPDRTI